MKDLEKIFYGNIVAYDAAMTQEAKHQDLVNVLWRYSFLDLFFQVIEKNELIFQHLMPLLVLHVYCAKANLG